MEGDSKPKKKKMSRRAAVLLPCFVLAVHSAGLGSQLTLRVRAHQHARAQRLWRVGERATGQRRVGYAGGSADGDVSLARAFVNSVGLCGRCRCAELVRRVMKMGVGRGRMLDAGVDGGGG